MLRAGFRVILKTFTYQTVYIKLLLRRHIIYITHFPRLDWNKLRCTIHPQLYVSLDRFERCCQQWAHIAAPILSHSCSEIFSRQVDKEIYDNRHPIRITIGRHSPSDRKTQRQIVQHMQVKWSERPSGSGNQVGLRETFTVELTVLRRPLRGKAKTGHDRLLPILFIKFRLIFAYSQINITFVALTAL